MIGDVLKQLREQRHITQEQLADTLNLTRTTISHYESNINEPSLETLVAISVYFGVTTDYLLGINHPTFTNIKHEEYFKNKFEAFIDEFYITKK